MDSYDFPIQILFVCLCLRCNVSVFAFYLKSVLSLLGLNMYCIHLRVCVCVFDLFFTRHMWLGPPLCDLATSCNVCIFVILTIFVFVLLYSLHGMYALVPQGNVCNCICIGVYLYSCLSCSVFYLHGMYDLIPRGNVFTSVFLTVFVFVLRYSLDGMCDLVPPGNVCNSATYWGLTLGQNPLWAFTALHWEIHSESCREIREQIHWEIQWAMHWDIHWEMHPEIHWEIHYTARQILHCKTLCGALCRDSVGVWHNPVGLLCLLNLWPLPLQLLSFTKRPKG